MEPHALDRLVEKGFRGFRISPRGEAEVDHLTVRVNRAPEVAPLATNTDIGLIHMLVDACAAQVPLGSLRQFRAEFLNPTIHGRPIDYDAALLQKIDDILVGQRITQVPAHRAEDDVLRETMVFERGFARHARPPELQSGQRPQIMQQSRPN